MPLRLYSFDRCVYGMSVVVAQSKEEAIRIMREQGLDPSYAPQPDDEIQEHEIVDGLLVENHGDR